MLASLTIDLVNPKFKSFNRPLFLAILVAAFTLMIFIWVYLAMLNDCTSSSFVGSPTYLAQLVDDGSIRCINKLQKQGTSSRTYNGRITDTTTSRDTLEDCFFAPPLTADISSLGDPSWDSFANWTNTKDWYTSEEWWQALEDDSWGYEGGGFRGYVVPNHDRRPELAALRTRDIFCEGSDNLKRFYGEGPRLGGLGEFEDWTLTWEERIQDPNGDIHFYGLWHKYQVFEEQCDLKTVERTDLFGDNLISAIYPKMPIGGFPIVFLRGDTAVTEETILVAEYETCPEQLATLGSAFGWAAFIELGVTIVLVSLLMAMKLLVNNQWTYRKLVKEMIVDAFQEDDNKKSTSSSGAQKTTSGVIPPSPRTSPRSTVV